MQPLSPDKPLKHPDYDRLGYAPFARMLAKSIATMIPRDGLVIAVYGQWGLGKSTVLEFVEYYLKEDHQQDIPIIMRFNPWWFSGNENLVRHFFEQMQVTLGANFRSGVKSLVDSVQRLSDVVAEIPVPGAKVPQQIADQASSMLVRNVPQLKAEVAKKLSRRQKRIVVMIDDIDRLLPEEVRQLFTVVKAVADFPNVVYLLAFDKQIVGSALGVRGNDYLDKIVQVSFELPLPSESRILSLLDERLLQLFGELPKRLTENTFWNLPSYRRHLYKIINTPRKLIRLINTISVTFPAIKGEVNLDDFLLIEIIRVFYPEAYDSIRRNKLLLVEEGLKDSTKQVYKEMIAGLENPEALEVLLTEMFPKLNSGKPPLWRTEEVRRICYPDTFDVYFSLAIAEDDVPNIEVEYILAQADSTAKFVTEILRFQRTKANLVVALFRRICYEKIASIPEAHIPHVISGVFQVSDRILGLGRELYQSRGFESDGLMQEIVFGLIHRLPRPRRYEIIASSIAISHTPILFLQCLTFVYESHSRMYIGGRIIENRKIFEDSEVLELEETAKLKIESFVNSHDLFDNRYFPLIMFLWKRIDPDKAKSWLDEMLTDYLALISFLSHYQWVNGIGALSIYGGFEIPVDMRDIETSQQIKKQLEVAIPQLDIDSEEYTIAHRWIGDLESILKK